MQRSSSSDGGSEANRHDQNSSFKYNQQNTLSPQQQKQIQAQQQLQQHQYQAQQQKQLQMQKQIHQFQHQQQQQKMQEYQQQQQQFAANQQYYNQAPFYNYQPYVPSQSPLLYNNGPGWNYMSTPPPFFASNPSPSTPQPPLPPPDMKPEKPPLPKDPEPGNDSLLNSLGAGLGGMQGPRLPGGIRMRGLNGMNAGLFNGGPRQNGNASGMPGTSNRNRRRNPHFFTQMQPPQAPLAQDLTRPGEFNDLAQLLDEDIPAGADKFTIFMNSSENGRVQVNKKAKRKPMSTRYTRTKLWVREEAEAALALEKEFNRMQKRPMLILKFPDPDLNKYIVKKYSPFIDTVHFQQPSTPRYCFVQLKEDADVEKVVNTIRQIPFGTGHISAEVKSQHVEDQQVTPDEIDPYTLYIGNLPTHISVRVVKQYFPNAQRIDIGYAQRMRYTRYAFIRYNTVAESMEAYKKTVNALLDSRSLIVRFRRQKGNIGLPGEPKMKIAKRDDKEESTSKDEKAPNESQTDDDLTKEDECVSDTGDVEPSRGNKIKVANLNANQNLSTEAVNPKAISTTTAEALSDTVEVAANPPVHKENAAPNQVQTQSRNPGAEETTTSLYSPESLGEEVDSKDKVLEQARQLMKKNKRRAVSPINFSAFAEPTDLIKGPVEGDIKLEHTDDEDSSDDGGINLLGTRVKDEPFETPQRGPMDELYFDDYDYDDLCTDIEDDDDNWSNTSDRSRQLLTTNWDLVRRNELNAREDKPDIRTIDVELHQSLLETAPTEATLKPKQEVDDSNQQAAQKIKRDQLAVKQELEDMFNRLNSDVECDDEDAFFGHT